MGITRRGNRKFTCKDDQVCKNAKVYMSGLTRLEECKEGKVPKIVFA